MSDSEVFEQAVRWERDRASACRRDGRQIQASDVQDAYMAGYLSGRYDAAKVKFAHLMAPSATPSGQERM